MWDELAGKRRGIVAQASCLQPGRQAGSLPYGRRRGTALIVAVAIIVLLAGLAAVLLSNMRARAERSEVNAEDIKSFEAAEAGLDAAIRDINQGGAGCLGLGWTDDGDKVMEAGEFATGGWQGALSGPSYPNDGVKYSAVGYVAPRVPALKDTFREKSGTVKNWPRPQASEFDFYTHAVAFGDVRYFTFARSWKTDGVDNDGNGLVDDDTGEKDWYTIWSTGFSNPATPQGKFTTVEAIARRLIGDFSMDAALEVHLGQYKP